MSYLACDANSQLDKSIKSQSSPLQPHGASQVRGKHSLDHLQRELNDPHYLAVVCKHYEASNLNYQSLNNWLPI